MLTLDERVRTLLNACRDSEYVPAAIFTAIQDIASEVQANTDALARHLADCPSVTPPIARHIPTMTERLHEVAS